ncbi:hypothetical protein [Streptomyces sp. NBC_00019]
MAQLAGEELLSRILAQLPAGYALLFGRAELTTCIPSRSAVGP